MSLRASFAGGLTAGLLLLGVNYMIPDPPFMEIQNMAYDNGYVYLERSIREPDTWADWQVNIVPSNYEDTESAPVCSGQGSNEYTVSEVTIKSYHINDYTGDGSCLDKLIKGNNYKLYISWVPRDGRAPVLYVLDFVA